MPCWTAHQPRQTPPRGKLETPQPLGPPSTPRSRGPGQYLADIAESPIMAAPPFSTAAPPHATFGTDVHPDRTGGQFMGTDAHRRFLLAEPLVCAGSRADTRRHAHLCDRVPVRSRAVAARPRAL